MRVCTKCGIEKLESEFFFRSKSKLKLHEECKACYKDHRRTYYREHYRKYHERYIERARKDRKKRREAFRAFLLKYLSDKSCVMCGESDIRVLEFDHIDPMQKKFNISQAVHEGFNLIQVASELTKCRILCANCHRKHTAQQMGWYKAF